MLILMKVIGFRFEEIICYSLGEVRNLLSISVSPVLIKVLSCSLFVKLQKSFSNFLIFRLTPQV